MHHSPLARHRDHCVDARSRINFLEIQSRPRHGGVTVLLAVVLPVLAILAAFAINSAHMQLTKTELMIASDAAARSAGRTFSEEQTVDAAKQAAMITAALNDVNNEPLQLSTSDGFNEIEFGYSEQEGSAGRFVFNKIPTSQVDGNELTVSSVRINAKRDGSSQGGKVELIFPSLMSRKDFSPTTTSVAMQVDRDISLVLDRSGSMEWPDYDWPSGFNMWSRSAMNAAADADIIYYDRRGYAYYSSGQDENTYKEFMWEEYLDLGPRPPTPWENLVVAVNAFLDVLDETPQNEQVSIASYSNYGTLDIYLTHDYDDVRNIVDSLSTGGGTGIGRGMQQGELAFEHANARPFASKTMVVMTDGNHNSGIDPDDVARTMMSNDNVNIQTVTFSDGANQADMQEVARIGAGKHYHASSGSELVSAFEEIANNLPTILTK
ncbi:vWA domain-containing protein [Aporhodopirellula aestuarii]|uniref:VWA domain-containing protein n=1 Tax=Aporhodopirellula aestuarii TaxID=2950107 RepID=A0ABT0U7A0_9BACT|nr:vWA domain-containing protein [Aporhodopirellula aestuarii]MCM2372430.1 VWA domain-containing protein [Aporhodopirellula aestuarii]